MPPYSYCRNPITFGALLYYLGFGILISSFSFIGLSILLMILIILYLKFIEERELKERFGESYIKYKVSTPFLIPWPRINKKMKEV
jgi:protein-S-isoprenylcysteine O-methyltransferase Ste14